MSPLRSHVTSDRSHLHEIDGTEAVQKESLLLTKLSVKHEHLDFESLSRNTTLTHQIFTDTFVAFKYLPEEKSSTYYVHSGELAASEHCKQK
jgi:hypothetical protein